MGEKISNDTAQQFGKSLTAAHSKIGQAVIRQAQQREKAAAESAIAQYLGIDALSTQMAEFLLPLTTALIKVAAGFKNLWRSLPRLESESIMDYVYRNPNALDNPDVRWEYQAWVWSTPIRLLRRVLKR